METITNTFLALDGTPLEIRFLNSLPTKGIIVFWPCTSGDAGSKLYQIPQAELINKGFGLVLYNPRGHGKSGGDNHLYQGAQDLLFWLEKTLGDNLRALPLYGVGHSAGGAGILRTASQAADTFNRVFVVSPIMSSRESLFYMYERGSINVFLEMFASRENEDPALIEVLKKTDWLDPKFWADQQLRKKFDHPLNGIRNIRFNSVGQFLENISQPGHDVYADLKKVGHRTQIFLPTEDLWFPKDKTLQAANTSGALVFQPDAAKDHFFKGAWADVWRSVVNMLP